MNPTIMNQVASILDKTAEYIERLEGEKLAARTEEKKKVASALASRLTEAVGEPVDPTLAEKLSNLDPEVGLLISKLAGTERVDSLGEPSDNETQKVASSSGLPPAEAHFMEWLHS
jgi:hypothetical protein